MDQIRTSLEVLFIDQDIKSVYNNKKIDVKSFTDKLRNRGLGGTLDQLGIIAKLVTDKWMESDCMASNLLFCPVKSVFNVLLHATNPVLHKYNHMAVCKYENLFKWQALSESLGEDLLVTSYLASSDLKSNITRTKFDWKPYIDHDCKEINLIFEREMVELHSHLYGSSLNFDISWMYLMNNPRPESLIPAAIRYYLFLYLNHVNEDLNLEEIINTVELLPKEYHSGILRHKIQVINQMYGRRFSLHNGSKEATPDYAICGNDQGLYSILGGERCFMYNMFRLIYSGKLSNTLYPQLFHIYLFEKERMRHDLIQLDNGIGFANFANYDERKCKYIPWNTIYSHLLQQLSIGSYLDGKEDKRYIEERIVPQTDVHSNVLTLKEITSTVDSSLKLHKGNTEHDVNYRFIYHFIKQKDQLYRLDNLNPRHYLLRNKVKRQAMAIYNLRQSQHSVSKYVVGIDAANSEMFARPEVFAQAFRYLRHHDSSVDSGIKDLGFTYHVGEDFYDIVDGLRAIDELLKFIELRNGDRIGHGLVLGTDVDAYYKIRNNAICAPREILLDNAAWLYNVSLRLMPYTPSHSYIEKIFRYYYNLIYDHVTNCDIRDYYDSWLLRGDNPTTTYNRRPSIIDRWERYDYSEDEEVMVARDNHKAVNLYNAYHYNENIKRKGAVGDILKIESSERQGFSNMISTIQEYFLSKIEEMHISIECNPTSNLRIGDIQRYEEHPIFKFNNLGIETGYPHHCLSVSINTDDKGVFGTSQEREYSLIALALEKNRMHDLNNKPGQIIDWLDKIRQLSVSNSFK